MERKRITLADGRYLIFYSFDGEPRPRGPRPEEAGGGQAEPDERHEGGEGRDV